MSMGARNNEYSDKARSHNNRVVLLSLSVSQLLAAVSIRVALCMHRAPRGNDNGNATRMVTVT